VFGLRACLAAQQMTAETRDPNQKQDESFAKSYKEWLVNAKHGSPLVDHLPVVAGIPTPKDVLGYHIGAPKKLTYYADQLKYYRALARGDAAREGRERSAKSDEGRELVVVWVTSEANMKSLAQNREKLAQARRSARLRSADQAAHRDDASALSPDGRAAQRRDRPVRDADGARVPLGDGDRRRSSRRSATTCSCP
jgi:hypothetical protein